MGLIVNRDTKVPVLLEKGAQADSTGQILGRKSKGERRSTPDDCQSMSCIGSTHHCPGGMNLSHSSRTQSLTSMEEVWLLSERSETSGLVCIGGGSRSSRRCQCAVMPIVNGRRRRKRDALPCGCGSGAGGLETGEFGAWVGLRSSCLVPPAKSPKSLPFHTSFHLGLAYALTSPCMTGIHFRYRQ